MKTTRPRRRPSIIAVAGVLAFLLIVLVEHLINQSLDPMTHEVSEYVHASQGWLMTAGFIAWAASLAASAMWVNADPCGKPLCLTLLVAAFGMSLTACFATQTSAGRLPPGMSLGDSGRLHDLGSGLATVALLTGALLSLRIRARSTLRTVTAALLVFAAPADVVLLALGSDVAGIRQRLLILVACVWQLGLLMLQDSERRPSAGA